MQFATQHYISVFIAILSKLYSLPHLSTITGSKECPPCPLRSSFPHESCIRHAEGTELNNFDVVNYIPEPATATLSLLALAGLAARRRRK